MKSFSKKIIPCLPCSRFMFWVTTHVGNMFIIIVPIPRMWSGIWRKCAGHHPRVVPYLCAQRGRQSKTLRSHFQRLSGATKGDPPDPNGPQKRPNIDCARKITNSKNYHTHVRQNSTSQRANAKGVPHGAESLPRTFADDSGEQADHRRTPERRQRCCQSRSSSPDLPGLHAGWWSAYFSQRTKKKAVGAFIHLVGDNFRWRSTLQCVCT